MNTKVVLVTGGGGSIGSELCRQIASFAPSRLAMLDIYENNAYELERELKSKYDDKLNLTVLIGSVRDEVRLEQVMKQVKPQVIFHAAAHKHVPLMEDSPAEAVKNNIFGTLNVARAADRHGVSRMVIHSSISAAASISFRACQGKSSSSSCIKLSRSFVCASIRLCWTSLSSASAPSSVAGLAFQFRFFVTA